MVYTWWGWHIYKEDEVGVDVDQLGEEMEAKGETSPAECPPIECGQSDGATDALDRKDRVSEWTGRWSCSDRTLGSCVRSELTYGDAGRAEAGEWPDAGAASDHD